MFPRCSGKQVRIGEWPKGRRAPCSDGSSEACGHVHGTEGVCGGQSFDGLTVGLFDPLEGGGGGPTRRSGCKTLTEALGRGQKDWNGNAAVVCNNLSCRIIDFVL